MPTDQKLDEPKYHLHKIEVILKNLKSKPNGLDPTEATKRLALYGRNELVERKIEPKWMKFLRQFSDVLIIILMIAAVITAILKPSDIDWIVISNGVITDGMDRGGSEGLSVATLSEVAHAPGYEHPLADLNAALLPDGLHIRVHANTTHDRPLGLLIADGSDSQPGVAQA